MAAPSIDWSLLGGVLALLPLLPPVASVVLRRAGYVETNFRGERIPQSAGITLVIYAAGTFSAAAWRHASAWSEVQNWLVTLCGFGLLGFVDDLWGTKAIKGLRGHFRAFLRQRTVTSGFIKAIGGALLALWLGWRLAPDEPAPALLNAALIALAANAVNLLDLRPGRAGGVFLIGAAVLLVCNANAVSTLAGVPPLLFVVLPASILWLWDRCAKLMLGDAGSNPLGASLGLAFAGYPVPMWGKILGLVLLVAFHILTERVSLTLLIERTPVLRALDRVLGVRS